MNKSLGTLLLALLVFSVAAPASATCYYAYKAKQDNPLQLHYGVIGVEGVCRRSNNETEIRSRLSRAGWTLLVLLSEVPQTKLNSYQEQAGEYFLRY